MRLAFLVLVSMVSVMASAQTVHKWTDAQGVVHYGDRPPPGAKSEQVRIAPPPPSARAAQGPASALPAAGPAPAPAQDAAPQPLEIVMYARTDCGYCAKARRYFAGRGLRYVERDVQRDARANAEWKRLGGTGVPLFVINRDVSHGFSESGMAERLARYGW